MTKIKITLNKDDFRALVNGDEITIDDTGRMRVSALIDHSIQIILEDMGWRDMAAIIKEVWSGDAPEATVKSQNTIRDFDWCECGDYRQDHDAITGICQMPSKRAHGLKPCLAFKLFHMALEIPESFRST